jgi:hypothetical protein
MKKLIILAIFTICVNSVASSQTRKNFYSVTLDTIQHINWPKHQTVEQAQRNNTLEYPYYWTDRVVWEYDLINKTATWKGGLNTQIYKIYSAVNYNGVLTLTVGDSVQVGWTVQIKNQPDGTILFTSRNVELVDGKLDGSFSKNVDVVSRL